jgi:hypothetical protein
MEKYRQSQSCTQDYPPPYRMTHPRKSLSTSNLFNEPQVNWKGHLLKAEHSVPATGGNFSFEDECSNPNSSFDFNPRINIYGTDPQPTNNQTLQLKYQASSVHTMKKETHKHSQSRSSKSNLQVRQNREDGGSFSFSDLDPVEEDFEIGSDPDNP